MVDIQRDVDLLKKGKGLFNDYYVNMRPVSST